MSIKNNKELLDDAGHAAIPRRYFYLLTLSIMESTLGFILIAWASIKVVLYISGNHTSSVITILLLLFLLLLLTPIIMYVFRFRQFKRNLLSRLINNDLRNTICPVCGYHLQGLESDGINRITCPECGSVWKLLQYQQRPGTTPKQDVILHIILDSVHLSFILTVVICLSMVSYGINFLMSGLSLVVLFAFAAGIPMIWKYRRVAGYHTYE